jgi:hypothetical protein
MNGCWQSCFTAGDGTSSGTILNHNIKLDDGQQPFVADEIIANSPSMAHIHCAERLGVPLTIICYGVSFFSFSLNAIQVSLSL